MTAIPNVLANRYASEAITSIWSLENKILLERELWIAVMKAQQELGLDIPQEAIHSYEQVKKQINIDSINKRELKTRHDVKARIEEFCDLAGHEYIHQGMTSRDLTENVEQLQVFKSLQIILNKANAALFKFAQKARTYQSLPITARTHNVPAQLSSLGKRFAMWGEELLRATKHLHQLISEYPIRGIKGAVGTQSDMLHLFNGDTSKVKALEERINAYLKVPHCFTATGQVYPRNLDFEVVSIFNQLASPSANFCKTLRLMAGHNLAHEGFAKGQTGSSAMPHKINCRSCERLQGFHTLIKGYLTMAAQLSGDEWNEGDVSCSIVRRVVLPDSFFAIDGLFESLLNILNQLQIHPAAIEQENKRQVPFMLTSVFMLEATRQGLGRETAHKIVKEHAMAAAQALLENPSENTLLQRLEQDKQLNFTQEHLDTLMAQHQFSIGNAEAQVQAFCSQVEAWLSQFPTASKYEPSAML